MCIFYADIIYKSYSAEIFVFSLSISCRKSRTFLISFITIQKQQQNTKINSGELLITIPVRPY